MNTYLVPINEGKGPFIKKVVARTLQNAEEKLYNYFYNKYDWLEGDSLQEILDQLYDKGIDLGNIYDIEDFT